jgi:hypothetical protein
MAAPEHDRLTAFVVTVISVRDVETVARHDPAGRWSAWWGRGSRSRKGPGDDADQWILEPDEATGARL